jgi:hypothetical protein
MFNKGDFIVCINNTDTHYQPQLTIGKQYEVFAVKYDGVITIVNDVGNPGLYGPQRFISVQQAREEKLNIILDERNI